LWADDGGAVISSELVLVLAIVVLGLIPGLVALRNTDNAALATIGNQLLALQAGFSFAPFTIIGSLNGETIASVDGGQFLASSPTFLMSTSVGTVNTFGSVPVNPAP
jgi:hypothetical protein